MSAIRSQFERAGNIAFERWGEATKRIKSLPQNEYDRLLSITSRLSEMIIADYSDLDVQTKPAMYLAWRSLWKTIILFGPILGLTMSFNFTTAGLGILSFVIGIVFGFIAVVTLTLEIQVKPLIQHLFLRILLYHSGHIPWNYARFLDYASERLFLRKVGGGYIFIHRLLLDYFAALEEDPALENT